MCMKFYVSTFDKLVDTLSTDEAQTMLANIADSMRVSEDIQTDSKAEPFLIDEQVGKNLQMNDEPLFVRMWLRLRAFFKSLPIESIYEEELIRRIGKTLNRHYKQYISVRDNIFTNDFYELLRELRKTQLFFTSLLSAYDSDKGNFYLLISSFAIPEIYIKLMYITDPSTGAVEEIATPNLRADYLKKIDDTFSLVSPDHKAEMYRCANAIEWMRHYCDLPIDKALLRFTVDAQGDASCPIHLIASEIESLASVLSVIKPIPDIVLQSLFLLSQQDRLNDKLLDLDKESIEFISHASHALEAIKCFSVKIPIFDFARYAMRSINWEPLSLESGEDWFLLFKTAWKKRFSDRWHLWSAEQKRATLRLQMSSLLQTDGLHTIPHRPWEDAWMVLKFKRELSFNFLASFFTGLYLNMIQPILKILLMEGKFYRRENQEEYTNAFTVLEKQESFIFTFESRLSPEGEVGNAFAQLKEKAVASLKSKNSLESLMKGIESDAKQLVVSSQTALKTLIALLNGFIEGNKNSVYAPLLNWSLIQGTNNADFRGQVENVKKILQKTAAILIDIDKLETEF